MTIYSFNHAHICDTCKNKCNKKMYGMNRWDCEKYIKDEKHATRKL